MDYYTIGSLSSMAQSLPAGFRFTSIWQSFRIVFLLSSPLTFDSHYWQLIPSDAIIRISLFLAKLTSLNSIQPVGHHFTNYIPIRLFMSYSS